MARIFYRSVGWVVLLFAIAASNAGAQEKAVSTWKVGEPIVTYWDGPKLTDAAAKVAADGGWNLVLVHTEAELDVAGRHGLRATLRHNAIPRKLGGPETIKRLDALIDRVHAHPALYAYFVRDEPKASEFPALAEVVAHIRQRDPEHLAYINLLPCNAPSPMYGIKGEPLVAYGKYLDQFIKTVDPVMLSYDHYPFIVHGGELGQYFLNLSQFLALEKKTGLPYLNIIQACATLSFMRVPNGDEMRFCAYTTLAYGGCGISYYVYYRSGLEGGVVDSEGNPLPVYDTLKTVNKEFVAIGKELQPLESTGVYHAGMIPQGTRRLTKDSPFQLDPAIPEMGRLPLAPIKGIALGCFGPATKDKRPVKPTHVLVVNLDYQAKAATTLVGRRDLEIFDAGEKKWTAAGGRRADLSFPPGGGKLVRVADNAK
jgi:hypothetical protein